MKPKQLSLLAQVKKNERFPIIAQGLHLLAENVEALTADAEILNDRERYRAGGILTSLAAEEAAKAMMLLDLTRIGWDNNETTAEVLKWWYNHLARGLYVRAYEGKPASLKEVHDYMDFYRRERYLDGPNDVDWLFHNEVSHHREAPLYVDYLQNEDGTGSWASPADYASVYLDGFSSPPHQPMIIGVFSSMSAAGLLTVKGLKATRQVWDGVEIDDGTHWTVVEGLNRATLENLYRDPPPTLPTDPALVAALRLVVDGWVFPLTGLNMSETKVSLQEIAQQREDWLAAQY